MFFVCACCILHAAIMTWLKLETIQCAINLNDHHQSNIYSFLQQTSTPSNIIKFSQSTTITRFKEIGTIHILIIFHIVNFSHKTFDQSLPEFISPTCPKAKFRNFFYLIQTNSSIIFICPNPVGQVGQHEDLTYLLSPSLQTPLFIQGLLIHSLMVDRHRASWYPGGQSHLYSLTRSIHWPPLWHGLDAHSSMFVSQWRSEIKKEEITSLN